MKSGLANCGHIRIARSLLHSWKIHPELMDGSRGTVGGAADSRVLADGPRKITTRRRHHTPRISTKVRLYSSHDGCLAETSTSTVIIMLYEFQPTYVFTHHTTTAYQHAAKRPPHRTAPHGIHEGACQKHEQQLNQAKESVPLAITHTMVWRHSSCEKVHSHLGRNNYLFRNRNRNRNRNLSPIPVRLSTTTGMDIHQHHHRITPRGALAPHGSGGCPPPVIKLVSMMFMCSPGASGRGGSCVLIVRTYVRGTWNRTLDTDMRWYKTEYTVT